MNLARIALALAAAAPLAFTGCGSKKKITELQRKEAAHLVSEAEFALTLRDWARAEGLLAKAVQICPDTGAYWLSLGTTRMRLGQRGPAKDAYQTALEAFADEAATNRSDPDPWLRQAYVLALLGRVDDGRALLDKAAKQFPQDRNVRGFIEGKQLDRLIEQPDFKQVAL